MLYVQIPSAFRSAWGLKSNPSLMGRQLDVDRRAVGVLLAPGHDVDERLRLQRHVDEPTPTAPRARRPAPDRHDGSVRLDLLRLRHRQDRLGAAHRAAPIISSGVTTLTYDQVWTALKDTDQDPATANNVIEVYSGRSIAKSDNGGGVDQWNREHVWAKSHGDFGTANGPGTDVHHLRPEDVTVNSTRGNLDFDNGGSAVAQCTGCLSDGDSFEPRDAVKGDVARMIFYMAVR